MNFADILFLLIVLLFIIKGFFKGFLSEFMSMGALIAGIAAALTFRGYVADLLKGMVKNEAIRIVVALFLLFIGTYILVKLVERILHNAIEAIDMNSLDRLLGFVWGLFEAFVIILLVVYLIYYFKFKAGITFIEDSVIAKYAREFLQGFNFGIDKVEEVIGEIEKNV